MTKWIISSFSFLIFATVLFINLQNNSEINDEFNTNLANVTNEEMESVIDQNPDIYPMRMALANRYFDDLDYSQALPHYMYIAENSADNELKSFALAQIGWMVYESNNLDVATTYLNESLRINSESLVAKSYLGIIYIQDPAKQNEGLDVLKKDIVRLANNLNSSWWQLREQYQGISTYENRNEEYFDPGAKYHIPGNTPYTRYYLARIMQYQFHELPNQSLVHQHNPNTI